MTDKVPEDIPTQEIQAAPQHPREGGWNLMKRITERGDRIRKLFSGLRSKQESAPVKTDLPSIRSGPDIAETVKTPDQTPEAGIEPSAETPPADPEPLPELAVPEQARPETEELPAKTEVITVPEEPAQEIVVRPPDPQEVRAIYDRLDIYRYLNHDQLDQREPEIIDFLNDKRDLINRALADPKHAYTVLIAIMNLPNRIDVGEQVESIIRQNTGSLAEYLKLDVEDYSKVQLQSLSFDALVRLGKASYPGDTGNIEHVLELLHKNLPNSRRQLDQNPHLLMDQIGKIIQLEETIVSIRSEESYDPDALEYTEEAESGTIDPESPTLQMLDSFFESGQDNPEMLDQRVEYIQALSNNTSEEVKSRCINWLSPILSGKFGIPNPEEIVKVWVTSAIRPGDNIRRSMERMNEVQEALPGEPVNRILYQDFGIKRFHRYPVELLVKQYQERDRNDEEYGILIGADDDPGDTFASEEYALHKFGKDIDGKFYLRIMETSGPLDIFRRLRSLDQKYGSQHKISFAILAAHGAEHAMSYGQEGRNRDLSTSDFSRKGADRVLQHFFVEHPFLLFLSCRTGGESIFENDPIAQVASRVLQAETAAPAVATSLDEITTEIDGKKIRLLPTYIDGPEVTRFFDKGKRVPQLGEDLAA